jgi:hypothetical protein
VLTHIAIVKSMLSAPSWLLRLKRKLSWLSKTMKLICDASLNEDYGKKEQLEHMDVYLKAWNA